MATDSEFVKGAQRLGQRIRTIRDHLALPEMTEAIGQLLLKRTLARFDRQVDPDGRAWPTLADSSERRKGYKGADGKPLLVESGAMRSAIGLIRGSAAGAIFSNTGASIRIGIMPTKVAESNSHGSRLKNVALYASVHNYGEGSTPQRRFLGIGRLDVKSVDSFLRRRAANAIESS